MHRPRTLRSRMLAWFVGVILLAIGTTVVVGMTTRPDPITGAEAIAHNMGARLAETWDDSVARAAYLSEVRDVTGFDARLVRDPSRLPWRVHLAVMRGASIVPDNPHHIFVPVVRDGTLLGALEMEKFGPRPVPWPLWRYVLFLALIGVALSTMASRVANVLSRPLEQLAHAADRFGGGDLTARAGVERRRGWVALEVREVAVAFDRMAGRVEAMVKGQRELLGAISHELRSPLGRARVALEIARDRLPVEDDAPAERTVRASLDDVEAQLGVVDGILGDLLDVTRAGLADLRKETRPFVDWVRQRVAEEPGPPPANVSVSSAAEGVALAFDGPLLGRALHNLVINARAHGHSDERPIEVSVGVDGTLVRVIVRDHGPGFGPGLAERAFEPFVRGDAARARPTHGAGWGLGLAIVRRIVEAHGGRVFARNAEGGGAEVGFELPSAPAAR